MTVVTTSRKPVPEVRSLARDLAFAIGAEYATRGKMGMGDLLSSHDGPILIVSRSGQSFLIQVFSGGEAVAGIRVLSFAVEEREGAISRGLAVSGRALASALTGLAGMVFFVDGLPEDRIAFDGRQRRRYMLRVAP
jgi:U3 small nucleolar ribonucleoprotein protein IMP4